MSVLWSISGLSSNPIRAGFVEISRGLSYPVVARIGFQESRVKDPGGIPHPLLKLYHTKRRLSTLQSATHTQTVPLSVRFYPRRY